MEYDYCPFCNKIKYGYRITKKINGKEQTWFMCKECEYDTYGRYEDEREQQGCIIDNSYEIILVPYIE